jgi:coatomer subunit beta
VKAGAGQLSSHDSFTHVCLSSHLSQITSVLWEGTSAKMDAAAYTVVAASDGIDSHTNLSSSDLRTLLQKPDDEIKLEALRFIISSTLNGQQHPTLLMPIIQYVLPSKSKAIKKMLHFYWEVCPKLDEEGKLKQEMILVW